MTAKQILDGQFDLLTETLQNVIAFDTTKSQPKDNAPFGENNRKCLDYVLDTARGFGLDVYDCDGYAGHAELKGSGKEVLGILGHLDVVPAKLADGWIYPPFDGVIADGKMYGRGTMDDKGPMIACLYAVKALKESGFEPSKTIRLIFGCDEESGMQCVEHYFSKVPAPDIAFSPDGDFPVINREKGIYQFVIDFGKTDGRIIDICAGERANVVAGKCVAKLDLGVDTSNLDIDTQTANNAKVLTATGKSAHGSTPEEGVNASWQIFRALHTLFPQDKAIAFITDKMLDYTGKSWGINLHDDVSGDLTCNIGVVRIVDGNLKVSVDVRFPVTYTCADFAKLLAQNTPYDITPEHVSEPLYVAADSTLVS
ncbi:MAG: Sapep family Mn(2+)-dependent dipeptidase, partial [Corallococcus sp.]|nr:Sapep family Mn(2+)-dependent dipeptidase [Corallococcus sp.]